MKKLSFLLSLSLFCLGAGFEAPQRAVASTCTDECNEMLFDCGIPAQCSQLWHACMNRCRGH